MSLLRRSVPIATIAVLAACSSQAARHDVNPIQQAIDATPADTLGLFAFRDSVIVRNNTQAPVTQCVIVLDEHLTGELGDLAGGETKTLMRSRFRPYAEPEEFYRRAATKKVMTCNSPGGPVRVTFVAGPEQTVFVPNRE